MVFLSQFVDLGGLKLIPNVTRVLLSGSKFKPVGKEKTEQPQVPPSRSCSSHRQSCLAYSYFCSLRPKITFVARFTLIMVKTAPRHVTCQSEMAAHTSSRRKNMRKYEMAPGSICALLLCFLAARGRRGRVGKHWNRVFSKIPKTTLGDNCTLDNRCVIERALVEEIEIQVCDQSPKSKAFLYICRRENMR